MRKLILSMTLALMGLLISACGANGEQKKAETKTGEVNVNTPAANANSIVKAADADDRRTANTSANTSRSNSQGTKSKADSDDTGKGSSGNSNASVNRKDSDDRIGKGEDNDKEDH